MNPLSWLLPFRWPLEIIAALAAVPATADHPAHLDTLPEQIPVHFGITGRPDRWAGAGRPGFCGRRARMYAIFSFITDLGLGARSSPRSLAHGV